MVLCYGVSAFCVPSAVIDTINIKVRHIPVSDFSRTVINLYTTCVPELQGLKL